MAKRENPTKPENNNKDRLPNGYFAKGNSICRMPKKGVTLNDLTKMIIAYEEAQGKGKDALLKHYIQRLYENDQLLAKFMDKYIASKTINQLTGDGEGIKFIIEKSYKKPERPKLDQKEPKTDKTEKSQNAESGNL